MEIWKEIPGLPKIYLVSNLGRIKRIETTYERFENGQKIISLLPEKIFKLNKKSANGYCRINLKTSLKNPSPGKVFLVHRIVCLAFFGESNLQVNHKNGIKTDNRIENLEYVTNQENRNHAVRMNLHANRSNGWCKITIEQIKEIKKMYQGGMKQKEIAKIFNIRQQTVSSLIRKFKE